MPTQSRPKGSRINDASLIIQEAMYSFKVIVIGQSGCGKTSFINKYMTGNFNTDYHVTVGVDFNTKAVKLDKQTIQLQIWDTCGQDIYRSVTSSFYRGASAIFLTYAIDSRTSFEKMNLWLEEFHKNGSELALVFLVGTKVDLPRAVTQQEAFDYLKKINGVFYVQISALTGEKITEFFEKAANTLYKKFQSSKEFRDMVSPHRQSMVSHSLKSTVNLNKPTERKKQGCCK